MLIAHALLLLAVAFPDDVEAGEALKKFKVSFRTSDAKARAGALGANVREPEVQVAVLGALGTLQDETALPTLHAAFREKDARVAQEAIEAAGVIRSASTIEPLIVLMKDLERFMRQNRSGGYEGPKGVGEEGEQQLRLKSLYDTAIKSVQSITKEPWSTLEEWQLWWKRHKATFKVAK